jgi:transcriptional regulator with XRE-family HTH domain
MYSGPMAKPGPKPIYEPKTVAAHLLHEWMRRKGYSQAEVARLLGWAPATLRRIVHEEVEPSVSQAFRLQDEITDGLVSARAWTYPYRPARRKE